MTESFLLEMKEKLIETKKTIIETLASEHDSFKAAVDEMHGRDLVDLATNDFDKRILDAACALEMKKLNSIDSAMIRMENGHYGQCAKCGKHINPERLRAMPYAVLCIKCKTESERRGR